MIVLKYKRKKPILHFQITDYVFGVEKQIFIMSNPKDYRTAMKLINSIPRKPKQKLGRKRNITKLFYRIDHFIKISVLTTIKPQYLRRFRVIAVIPESEINYEGISKVEKLMLKALIGFTGFFEHVIKCNSFSYFDDLQEELETR